jgi:glutathione S-transferase
MSLPKLTYFDAPVSRGEECRLALHLGGVAFEDNRIARETWLTLKPTTPFGSLPLLELPGKGVFAQSNAILSLVGRKHGLHPEDPFEAARHEAMMCHVEDLRHHVSPTLRISDEAEKKKARQTLAEGFLPSWARYAEQQIGDGPFFGGEKLNVVDIKLYIAVRWFASGTVDHVPSTVFDAFPKLMRVYASVRDDARVGAWYAKSAKPA